MKLKMSNFAHAVHVLSCILIFSSSVITFHLPSLIWWNYMVNCLWLFIMMCGRVCLCAHLQLFCLHMHFKNGLVGFFSRRDLSRNRISSLDTSLLDRLTGLRELWVWYYVFISYHFTTSHLCMHLCWSLQLPSFSRSEWHQSDRPIYFVPVLIRCLLYLK